MATGTIKRIGIAQFGLGRAGRVHFDNILANERLELKWVVDENVEATRSLLASRGLHGVRVVNTSGIKDVLADKTIEAVMVTTPTDTHVDISIRALQAGKHVMCEKPLSEDTSEIIRCFDVAEKCGKMLMAAFNRKFDVSYRNIYDKMRSGELGDIQFMRSTFRDSPLWLGAHTLSQTFLCHDIDILCWMVDELPDTVVSMTTAFNKEVAAKNDVDSIVVTMKFPCGTVGVLDMCRSCCYGYDIRLEVCGTKGMLKMEADLQHNVTSYGPNGKVDPPFRITFTDRFEQAYVAELNNFVDAIQGRAELFVKRVHSERVGIVMDAIKESYKTGQVVHLKK